MASRQSKAVLHFGRTRINSSTDQPINVLYSFPTVATFPTFFTMPVLTLQTQSVPLRLLTK
ncbi:MAG: hypothetical protein QM754_01530 [Tepidisphaeraceae bacterium]